MKKLRQRDLIKRSKTKIPKTHTQKPNSNIKNTTIFVWSIINMQDKNTVSYAWMKGNIKVLV